MLSIDHPVAVVAVLQCAMAPMITAGMLAEQHGLDPPLANTVVGIGILTSLATVPLWNFALR
jgi:malate permease and related proteins